MVLLTDYNYVPKNSPDDCRILQLDINWLIGNLYAQHLD